MFSFNYAIRNCSIVWKNYSHDEQCGNVIIYTVFVSRPKSASSGQPNTNGVQSEGLDYDRLKQVDIFC